MKINPNTVLIKAHYFMFFAGMVPVLPFSMVLGLGLGVPIALQGIMAATVLVGTVIAKPLLSLVADAFPWSRRIIFIASILLCGLSLGCICFVPAFAPQPSYPEAWLLRKNVNLSDTLNSADKSTLGLLTYAKDGTRPIGIRRRNGTVEHDFSYDSLVRSSALISNLSWTDLALYLPGSESCRLIAGVDCRITGYSFNEPQALLQISLEKISSISTEGFYSYRISSKDAIFENVLGKISVQCGVGRTEGSECKRNEVWTKFGFWAFFFLMMVGMVSFCTANSFSDAVTVETIGPSGNYGSQRAWGSLGWGLMGPVSGLLVDWWSGNAELKDYTPAYLLVFLIMGIDVALSTRLHVPKLEADCNVWSSVWPLLRQPRFLLFLFFSVLNGCFDGVVLNFLFVLQEDMAAGSDAMQHIKFLQGVTIFVQCATEVPCMFLSHLLVKRIGADRVTTVVLGLHAIRLFLITCVGQWGGVWLTVAVEVLNGPCYGLGYSAIVVYAGQLAPPGASTTVQSLANICYESIGYALSSITSGLIVSTAGSVRLFLVWTVVACITSLLHFLYVMWIALCVDPQLNSALKKRPDDKEGEGTVEENLCLKADGFAPQEIQPDETAGLVLRHSTVAVSNYCPNSGAFCKKFRGLDGLPCSDHSDSDETESEKCESAKEKLGVVNNTNSCHCICQSGVTVAQCERCADQKSFFLNGAVGGGRSVESFDGKVDTRGDILDDHVDKEATAHSTLYCYVTNV
ncbi:Major facilitator superfamily associated domain [Trinorchestia longiramus]|nr:Major facilitator superfamily associated domain [Trinorchestia longiramus]